jgi:hypothetical protein
VDGELDPSARAETEAHLASCATCRRTVELWREDAEAIAGAFAGAGDGFDRAVLEALEPRSEISVLAPRDRLGRLAAAAVLALAGLGAALLHLADRDTPPRPAREETGAKTAARRPETTPPGSATPTFRSGLDPLEAFAAGLSSDANACVDLLWRRNAEARDRLRAAESLVEGLRTAPPRAAARRRLGLRLVPLLHPDVDPLARDAAIRALEVLFGDRRGYRVEASRTESLEAIRAWYAGLRA